MVRLVVRLSRLAKIAAVVAAFGGALVIYARAEKVGWAALTGTILLFGGALVYFAERVSMIRKRR